MESQDVRELLSGCSFVSVEEPVFVYRDDQMEEARRDFVANQLANSVRDIASEQRLAAWANGGGRREALPTLSWPTPKKQKPKKRTLSESNACDALLLLRGEKTVRDEIANKRGREGRAGPFWTEGRLRQWQERLPLHDEPDELIPLEPARSPNLQCLESPLARSSRATTEDYWRRPISLLLRSGEDYEGEVEPSSPTLTVAERATAAIEIEESIDSVEAAANTHDWFLVRWLESREERERARLRVREAETKLKEARLELAKKTKETWQWQKSLQDSYERLDYDEMAEERAALELNAEREGEEEEDRRLLQFDDRSSRSSSVY